GVVLGLASLVGSVCSQELPEWNPARKKVVGELIDACFEAGAAKSEDKGAAAVVSVDPNKVRAVLAARRERRDGKLVDSLVLSWVYGQERFRPLVVALLLGVAREKKDDRAHGMASLLGAMTSQAGQRPQEAERGYREAARLLEKVNEPTWQAT